MKSKRMGIATVLGATSIALALIFAIAQTAAAKEPDDKLVGSWTVEVTTPSQGTFPALLTFTADGSVLEDESPLPFESSGHGSWVSKGHDQVAYTFIALFGGDQGQNTGRFKVVGTLQFDGRKGGWSGPFKITGFDANGQEDFSDSGTSKLTRIQVESFP